MTAGEPTPTRRSTWTQRVRYGWILETALGIGLYLLYDELRSHVSGSARIALRHGYDVVRWERAVALYQEHRIQQAFISWGPFLTFWNIYYGTIHFVMPVVALVTLWKRAPARYLRWRNVLLLMLTIGILAFWAYPLMPPRLMPTRYGFVDTAARFFNFGPQQRVVLRHGVPTAASRAAFGNLFAAMPSLHIGWSTWSALALAPVVRRGWVRALVLLYPAVTTFAIVVTANHWILDAVGGWVVLGAAWLVVVGVERLRGLPPLTRYA
ncbi:MAG: phosphatase PAP2 family protein [Acidimicrobiia bacterium]